MFKNMLLVFNRELIWAGKKEQRQAVTSFLGHRSILPGKTHEKKPTLSPLLQCSILSLFSLTPLSSKRYFSRKVQAHRSRETIHASAYPRQPLHNARPKNSERPRACASSDDDMMWLIGV
jgi:hypothetical protein